MLLIIYIYIYIYKIKSMQNNMYLLIKLNEATRTTLTESNQSSKTST
jgi:uncharacterized ion transporter superfamily protein YfcC